MNDISNSFTSEIYEKIYLGHFCDIKMYAVKKGIQGLNSTI